MPILHFNEFKGRSLYMHQRKIAVIGLGYVGLPVALAFGKFGQVIGFDINSQRIAQLQSGIDTTHEANHEALQHNNILLTTHPADLKQANFFIIAVPTPVDQAKNPDLFPVLKASKTVGNHLKKGDIVVYESTVYPGATEEVCVPVLEKQSGLKCGEDFFVGYSPERINPGDKYHTFTNTQKVVSGCNENSAKIIAEVYSSVVSAGVYQAPSIRVAEACKVIENIQRDVNIALMNELAMIFDRLGMDTQEVLNAAATKWNFLRFSPGLVGGHCIGVDPYYLVDKAKQVGFDAKLIASSRFINDGMGYFIANKALNLLVKNGYILSESTITILGLAFKENVPDLRNTRVVDIVSNLQAVGVRVQVHDPLVDTEEAFKEYGVDVVEDALLHPAQAIILAVAHQEYLNKGWKGLIDYLENERGVVLDVKSVLPQDQTPQHIELWRL
jgi:UDP-N-acetyl-D-glucosamine/UDP-N-acetyl-D-galactosamine dehydrogenase